VPKGEKMKEKPALLEYVSHHPREQKITYRAYFSMHTQNKPYHLSKEEKLNI
jgi:hypothetical protein